MINAEPKRISPAVKTLVSHTGLTDEMCAVPGSKSDFGVNFEDFAAND